MQKENAKASDSMTHTTKPSPEAQAVIDKLEFAFNQFGPRLIIQSMRKPVELLGGIAHAIGNKKFAPEYESLFMDAALFLFVNAKVQENVINQIKEMGMDPSAVSVMPAINSSEIIEEAQAAFHPTIAKVGEIKNQDTMPIEIPKPWCEACQEHHDIYTHPAQRIAIGVVTDQASGHDHVMLQLLDGRSHDSTGLHAVLSSTEVGSLAESFKTFSTQLRAPKES